MQCHTVCCFMYVGDGYVNVPPPSIMGNDKDVDKATSNFDDVSVPYVCP